MKPVENAVVERQLAWRYATKKFDTERKIAPTDWATLESALRLAPSSYGLQPYRFIVVADPPLRERLQAASWNQPQITEASHLVVFAARKNPDAAFVDRFMARVAEVRGVTRESVAAYGQRITGFLQTPGLDLTAWASRQAYIALGVFLTTAAMLGIDACPMEGVESPKYNEILGLDADGYTTLCVATAGYRSDADAYALLKKVRAPAEELIHHK